MKLTNKHAFFWKSVLGQWNKKPFVDNLGITYNCAEKFMMAHKALLFNDLETYQLIMGTDSPRRHQELGRIVKNYNQDVWDANACTIVYQGNMYKFSQNPELLSVLMSTGNRIIVEASPIDKIWGIGLSEDLDDDFLDDTNNWNGANWLGYTLTNLRDNYFKKMITNNENYEKYVENFE